MTVYPWPSTLAPRGVAFNPRGMTVGGPTTLSGRSQVASTDSGYWTAAYSRVAVGGAAVVKAFRMLRAKLEGGAHHVRVPVYDDDQVPYAAAGGATANAYAEERYSDSTYHSDGHGFYKPAIVVKFAAAGAVRDTLIYATVTTAGTISGGEYFSVVDRLHVVREVIASSGSARTLSIWPPLREAVAVGIRLDFEHPVCRMRLMSESEMDLALERGVYGFPDMAFVEVF